MIKYNKKSRRLFLQAAGKITIGLPFMPSLLPKGFAQTSDVPLRMVAFVTRFGTHYNNWQRMNNIMPTRSIAEGAWEQNLSSLPGQSINKVLGNRYASLYNKLTFLRGVDSVSHRGQHNLTLPLTATLNPGASSLSRAGRVNDSIDVILSKKIYQNEPQMRVFRVAPPMQGSQVNTHSWSFDNSVPQTADTDPRSAFQKLFDGAAPQPGTDFDEEKARQKLLIDKILPQYNEAMTSRRISSEDKGTFSDFADRLRDIQVKLDNKTQVSCDEPSIANYQNSNFEQMYHYINHTLIAGMQCDLTRLGIICINARASNSNRWWHDNTHHASYGSDPRKENGDLVTNQFLTSIIMHMIQEMDNVVEANGKTMLDNSLVFWTNEFASGNHTPQNMPLFVGGSAQGRIRNGVLLDYQQRPQKFEESGNNLGGDSHYIGNYLYNNFLMDIMRAMGASESDWGGDGYGDYRFGGGLRRSDYDIAFSKPRNHKLPGFLNI